MAFVDLHDKYPVDNSTGCFIEGRPDFGDSSWGKTRSKKHPKYVFATRGASALIHKIGYVEMHWWKLANDRDVLVRVLRPLMYAHTTCGQSIRLEARTARTCSVPNPDALLCGRCHGELATFGKHGAGTKANIRRSDAHVKLGCVVKAY